MSLRNLILSVARESDSPDPKSIAKEVMAVIPDDQVLDSFIEALNSYVRSVLSLERARRPAPVTTVAAKGRNTMIREAWKAQLKQRYLAAPGQWKFLADLTVTDLAFAQRMRETHAARTLQEASRLQQLREAIEAAHVETVGQLDEEVLATILR